MEKLLLIIREYFLKYNSPPSMTNRFVTEEFYNYIGIKVEFIAVFDAYSSKYIISIKLKKLV